VTPAAAKIVWVGKRQPRRPWLAQIASDDGMQVETIGSEHATEALALAAARCEIARRRGGTVMLTERSITDEDIRRLQRLDLCAKCHSGLLAPEHHNELMDGHHAHVSIDGDVFTTALYEFEYPSARLEARGQCAELLNAWDSGERS
jgi:hypothetical protein